MFSHQVDDEIELELLHHSHAEPLFRLVEECRDYLAEWLGWVDDTRTVGDTRRFIRDSCVAYANDRAIRCGIRWRGELCGTISIEGISRMNDAAELGYWIARRFQGHGIVTRSAMSLTELAFERLDLHRLIIRVARENERSRAIPERLGWFYEGTWREAVRVGDRRFDIRVYSRLCTDEFDD